MEYDRCGSRENKEAIAQASLGAKHHAIRSVAIVNLRASPVEVISQQRSVYFGLRSTIP